MRDAPGGADWWQAWDGKWYAPDEEPAWATEVADQASDETARRGDRDPGRRRPGLPADGPGRAEVQDFEQWSRRHEVPAGARHEGDVASEIGTGTGTGTAEEPPLHRAGHAGRSARSKRRAALVVAFVVLAAWVGTALALAATAGPGLSRMSAAQILRTTYRAALAARTAHVEIEETTTLGQQTLLSADVAADSGEAIETSSFANVSVQVVGRTIYADGNVSYWVNSAPGVAVTLENRWVSLPTGTSLIASQLAALASRTSILANLHLVGPYVKDGSGSPGSGPVTIHGYMPAGGFEPVAAGAPAALTVATSAPYLPSTLDVTFEYGKISMHFSGWGETVAPTAHPGALPLASVDPVLASSTSIDVAAQADVQEALTGVEVFGTSQGSPTRPDFAGLGPSAWAGLGTGVLAAFGSAATSPGEVSVEALRNYAVITAWAPRPDGSGGTCWGIVDDVKGPRVLGFEAPSTVYFEQPGSGYETCSAARFASSAGERGLVASPLGFGWLS